MNCITDKINLNLSLNNSVVPQLSIIAKGDSGASRHCFSTHATKILTNIGPSPATSIILPNNQQIQAHATANIPIKISQQMQPKHTFSKNLKIQI